MTSPLVEMSGISKRFGALTALRDIHLSLESGSSHAILGPNGAGKSTLLRILAGLARPTRGQIRIRGAGPDRSGVGYLGHATLLYPELSARENLVFAARLYGLRNPVGRAEELLAEEDLERWADRRTGGFSRGMAQRLAIARARIHDPQLLLLDEPFTGLDGPAAQRLCRRLGELNARGHALILVTHEIQRAVDLTRSATILVAGRIRGQLEDESLDATRAEAAYAEIVERTS